MKLRTVKALPALFLLCSAVAGAKNDDPEIREPVLEEILVTGTKRAVSLRDLAQSAGVLTGDQLEEMGALRLDDYWRAIPSLIAKDAPFGGDSVIIRGLSDTDNFQQNESLNAFYFDDTSITYVEGLFATPGEPTLVDVAQIEVLRGPQGTVVGANAMGGAIRIISNEPDPDAINYWTKLDVSNTAHGSWNYRVSAMFNLPLKERVSALRLAAFYHDDDGWIDDIGLGGTDINSDRGTGARVSYLSKIGDSIEVLARLYVEDRSIGGYNYQDPVGRLGLRTQPYQRVLLSDEQRSEQMNLGSLRLRWDTSWGELVSVTSWYDKDVDFSYDWSSDMSVFFGFTNKAPFSSAQQQEDVSQEIRFVSDVADALSWLAGAYYLSQESRRTGFGSTPGLHQNCPGCFPFVPLDEVILNNAERQARDEWALFGDVNWHFAPNWTLTLGGRWYGIRRSLHTRGFFAATSFDDDVEGDGDGFIPKISLAWEPSDRLMLYALASKGYRAGQFNNAPARACGARPILDSDDLWNYEVGARLQSAGDALAINVAAFHIDWSDIQASVFTLSCPFVFKENSGNATSEGLEIDFTAALGDGFVLRGGIGYNDAVLDEGFPALNTLEKARIPHVPKVTANLSGMMSFDFLSNMRGFARGEIAYVGQRTTSFTPALASLGELDSYFLANVGIGTAAKQWRVELYVNNVFDKVADLFCCRLPGFNNETAINRPRTVGIRTRYEF